MKSRVYIGAPDMLPALQSYENFLEGNAPVFLKKLFSLLAVSDQTNLRKLAEMYAPEVFAYCCFTWSVDPRILFTRDPRFMETRRVPTQRFLTIKELPLFTEDILQGPYGEMLAGKLNLCK